MLWCVFVLFCVVSFCVGASGSMLNVVSVVLCVGVCVVFWLVCVCVGVV